MANFQVSLNQMQHRLSLIRDALFGLQINLDILYNQYSALVNKRLTPEIVTTSQLLQILQKVKVDITNHPKLRLPVELNENDVYHYYSLSKFEIVAMKQYVMGVMEIPLIDKQ